MIPKGKHQTIRLKLGWTDPDGNVLDATGKPLTGNQAKSVVCRVEHTPLPEQKDVAVSDNPEK